MMPSSKFSRLMWLRVSRPIDAQRAAVWVSRAPTRAEYHQALALTLVRETSARATITSDLASMLALTGQPEAAIVAYRSAFF